MTITESSHTPDPSGGAESSPGSFLRTRTFLALVAIAGPLFFIQLGAGSIANSDDAFYAWSVRQAEREQTVLRYRWNGARLDFRYPPLHFLALRASVSVFGQTTLGLRLPAAVAGFACALMMAALIFRQTRSAWAALVAGLALTASGALYLSARSVRIDASLAATSLAAIWAYLRSWHRPRWLYAAAALAGLAVLTKGIIGLLAAFPIGLDLLTQPHRVRAIRPALLFVAIAASWHVYQLMTYGRAFIDTYLLYTIFARIKGIAGLANSEPISTLIWRGETVLLLLYAIGLAWLITRALTDRLARFVLAWTFAALLPLIVSSTRLPHYFVPAVAPLCAGAALALAPHLRRRPIGMVAVAGVIGIFIANNVGVWLDPDFTPGLRAIIALARPGATELVVYNHYHAAAEYYADLPTTLVTDDPRAFRLLTSVRAMKRGASVEYVAPQKMVQRLARGETIPWLTTALFEQRLRSYVARVPAGRGLEVIKLGAYVLVRSGSGPPGKR